jgi:hypothetical protein
MMWSLHTNTSPQMEDFNGEKSDRFMCETISEAEVLGMLDAAKLWLVSKQGTFKISFLPLVNAR